MQKYFQTIIFTILVIPTMLVIGQTTEKDSTMVRQTIISYDKFQHVAVSCLLTLSGQYVLENKIDINKDKAIYYSVSSSAIIGLTKELNDKRIRSLPLDWGDMIANLIGIGLAVIVMNI